MASPPKRDESPKATAPDGPEASDADKSDAQPSQQSDVPEPRPPVPPRPKAPSTCDKQAAHLRYGPYAGFGESSKSAKE